MSGIDPMAVPTVQVVVDVIPEIPDVVTIRTRPVDGPPPPFLPAQVSMLGAFGIGEAAISISSSPTQHDAHDYTVRRAGAITGALTRMEVGERFWLRGPFGTPWALDDAVGDDVLIAAGGIGVAPLRSAIYHVVEHRDRYRRVVLVVGARRSVDLLYRGEFAAWRAAGIDVVATIDRPEPEWSGPTGFVPAVVAGLDLDPARVHAFVCGPDVMMRRTSDELIAAGVESDRIQLTLERNMQCGTGRCGHCQLGGLLVCRDGPVVRYPAVATALAVPEL